MEEKEKNEGREEETEEEQGRGKEEKGGKGREAKEQGRDTVREEEKRKTRKFPRTFPPHLVAVV